MNLIILRGNRLESVQLAVQRHFLQVLFIAAGNKQIGVVRGHALVFSNGDAKRQTGKLTYSKYIWA